ncbi:MAG: hypothetical protein AAGM67_21845, partial [Bacteroidota bacterium]
VDNLVCRVANILFRDAHNDRGMYTGTVRRSDQMPHGYGRMVYTLGGHEYEGEWFEGHWHGDGVITDKNGDVYEGPVVDDMKHGEGVTKYADGRVCRGIYENNEAVEGTVDFPDGSKYIGKLSNGARHGYGVYYFNDGSKYEGESVMNVFEGHGKMIWDDGGWYEGEWKDNEMHGIGKEIRPDGSLRHEGQWSCGAPVRNG